MYQSLSAFHCTFPAKRHLDALFIVPAEVAIDPLDEPWMLTPAHDHPNDWLFTYPQKPSQDGIEYSQCTQLFQQVNTHLPAKTTLHDRVLRVSYAGQNPGGVPYPEGDVPFQRDKDLSPL